MLPILSLLTPRLMIVAAVAIALAGSHWSAYRHGKQTVRTEWQADTAERTAAALLQSERNRAQEQALQTAVRKVTHDYQAQKTRAAAADQRAADSLRQLTAALGADRAAGANTAAPAGADDDPRSASWPNVPQLLSTWTKRLDAWQARRQLCKTTPQGCV